MQSTYMYKKDTICTHICYYMQILTVDRRRGENKFQLHVPVHPNVATETVYIDSERVKYRSTN